MDQVKLACGLNTLKVNEGVNLYIEDRIDQANAAQLKDEQSDLIFASRWQKEFDIEKNSLHIRFNKPVDGKDDGPSGSNIYTESVVIDRRLLIEDLKQKIAEKLGESLDSIIFRRGNKHGAEMIEDDLPFKLGNIFNMMTIYMEKG